jgi:curli biogenesis system outer membrane secretion channel CsgG
MNRTFSVAGCARFAGVAALAMTLASCATVQPPPQQSEIRLTRAEQRTLQSAATAPQTKHLKQKIAIGRFTNETRYGRTFVRDETGDPLGKQASDMLAARLVESGAFLVFERPDLNRIQREQAITGQAELIGVDTLILGSVTEFGRAVTGQTGFLSSTKRQTAHAKVEIRLADARTGQVFFSAAGTGDASNEAGEIAGFGSRADYDATLNDKAIGAAISDVMNALVSKLAERPWRTDILKIQGNTVYISGGAQQGLKVGDVLSVMRAGETVKSAQTGFNIALPASEVGTLRIVQLFGDSETNEGAVAEIVGGSVGPRTDGLFVAEGPGGRS